MKSFRATNGNREGEQGAGSRAPVGTLHSRASSITFRLNLEEDIHPAYVAILERAEGQLVQHSDKLKSRLSDGNKVVDLRISSRLVRPGDYVIRLNGEEPRSARKKCKHTPSGL